MLARVFRKSWFSFIVIACISFGLASGIQIGHLRFSKTVKTASAVDRLTCANGESMLTNMAKLQPFDVQALFELGMQGRSALKTCLCKGFTSGECLALKIEIGDRVQLSTAGGF